VDGTLLSAMVNEASPTTGERVRQRVVFGHFITLLVAGHETTANTMGFLMYYLAKHPSWEARLRAEIRVSCSASVPGLATAARASYSCLPGATMSSNPSQS
jgi:cytochrome P450